MDIERVRREYLELAKAKDWEKHHDPKSLAAAINVEASELLEIFQWLTTSQAYEAKNDPGVKAHTGEEIADVFLYLLRLADQMDINLEDAVLDKMKKNRERFLTD